MNNHRIAVGLIGLGLAAIWFFLLGSYRVDDAYILYRYAHNVATGGGFAFNPGEPVEGASCFLWVMMLVPFAWLHLPLPVITPLLTCISGAAVVALMPGLGRSITGASESSWSSWAPAALLAAYPGFAFWSRGALETVPFTLALVLCLRAYLREKQSGQPSWRSAIWAGVAALLRPEASLCVIAIVIDLALDRRRNSLGAAMRWALVVALIVIPFMAFRIFYFGDWLPNTYYAKVGGSPDVRMRAGVSYSLAFFRTFVPGWQLFPRLAGWLSALLLLAVLVNSLRVSGRRVVAMVVIAIGVSILFEGGDWMAMFRFWIPALPFVLVLSFGVARDAEVGLESRRFGAAAVAGILLVAWVGWGVRERWFDRGLLSPQLPATEAYHRAADYLRARAAPTDLIALMDIGQIGFETGLPTVDVTGLVTPWIAKSPGPFLNKQYAVERLLRMNPRFILLRPAFPIDARIQNDTEFQARYRAVLSVQLSGDVLHVYERAVPVVADAAHLIAGT